MNTILIEELKKYTSNKQIENIYYQNSIALNPTNMPNNPLVN